MPSIDLQSPLETYMAALHVLPIDAFIFQSSGRITDVSQHLLGTLGFSRDAFLGMGYLHFVHPADRSRAIAHWHARRPVSAPYQDEIRIRIADGTYAWFLRRIQPAPNQQDAQGQLWLGTLTNIHAQKHREKQYHSQEEFLERILSSSDDCIKILDLDARLQFMSENGQHQLKIDDIQKFIGSSWIEFWGPEDRASALKAVDAALAGGNGRFVGTFNVADEPHWFDVVVSPIFDENNQPEKLLSISRDITEYRRTHLALKESEKRYLAFNRALPGTVWGATADGSIDFFDARDGNGDPTVVAEDDPHANWTTLLHPEESSSILTGWRNAIANGDPYIVTCRIRNSVDTYRWNEIRAFPVRDDQFEISRWIGVALDIHDQRCAEIERDFLAEAGRILSQSLDLENTLNSLAQLTIPQFADWCEIDLVARNGRVRIVAMAHRDPEKHILAQQLVGRLRPDHDRPAGAIHAIKTGESNIVENLLAHSAAVTADAETEAIYVRLGISAAASVPLCAGGKTLGAISVIRTSAARGYTADDLPVLEELGMRAGRAVQNAFEYEREHRVAESFQKASLPLRLPKIPGVRLDVAYLPGSSEATIGGDWYDVFALSDGRVVLTIGDVLGHGLHAAITMTKLRQAMQSVAILIPDPNVMLTAADKTLRMFNPDGYATAIAAIYDPIKKRLSLASAGHPGPMQRTEEGVGEVPTARGSMLGLRSGDETEITQFYLQDDQLIIFYTDGLVEATRDIEAGNRKLAAALQHHDVLSAEHPAAAVADYVLKGIEQTDDIAIVVLQNMRS